MRELARRFIQCDVFHSVRGMGNALAVVVDGADLSARVMQEFAAWTNLAETTFLLPPEDPSADYKVRIFTTGMEMDFAGHPTLGSCAAWLHAGGKPKTPGLIRQECNIGLVDIRLHSEALAFQAPSTTIKPMSEERLLTLCKVMRISRALVQDASVLFNGSKFEVLELPTAEDVLAIDATLTPFPEFRGIGVFAPHPGMPNLYEARNLAPSSGMVEDPVTGSMNAAIASWMFEAGRWVGTIEVRQGTALNRGGTLHAYTSEGSVWISGAVKVLVDGNVALGNSTPVT